MQPDYNSLLQSITSQGNAIKQQQWQDKAFWVIVSAIIAVVLMAGFDIAIGNQMRANALKQALQQQEVHQVKQ